MAKYPPTVHIEAFGLPDAWAQAVKKCMTYGMQKKREYGMTKDIVSLIEVRNPLSEPLLHGNFPTKKMHLEVYLKQWERGYDWKKQGFKYNYMDRLINYPKTDIDSRNDGYFKSSNACVGINCIDQVKALKDKINDRITKGGEIIVSNRDRIITWVPELDLFTFEDQPCLQSIQVFVYSYPLNNEGVTVYGDGEIHAVWRSRDLYNAWNSNCIGLLLMAKKEIFEPNKINIGRYVEFCNSLHIYEPDWENAKKVKQVATNPMYMRY